MKDTKTYAGSHMVEPGATIFLGSNITGLFSITEYSVANCSDTTRNDYLITASNMDTSDSLPCSSTTYTLNDLSIQNKSAVKKTIDVKLQGTGDPRLV